EVGNHADLAVLDRDVLTVPEEDIKGTRSLLTVVGGKVVHNALP
ncbi:MAG TPA: amidohydrolase family protein, partial [Terriglobia bacterium]|nr:amidohydrolase family protein [Terriglobia bacterium]